MTIRIGAIHALTASIDPIKAAFARIWPEAQVVNLLDQSLYADYGRWGRETKEIARRVSTLIEYSAKSGAEAILFSGSLFRTSVERARSSISVPVLTAYEAMIEAAFTAGTQLEALATVTDTITALERDIRAYAEKKGVPFTLNTHYVEGAMEALQVGDRLRHAALVAAAAAELKGCDALLLAQHSMGPVRQRIADVPGRQVLTSPDTAALKLKELIDRPST